MMVIGRYTPIISLFQFVYLVISLSHQCGEGSAVLEQGSKPLARDGVTPRQHQLFQVGAPLGDGPQPAVLHSLAPPQVEGLQLRAKCSCLW